MAENVSSAASIRLFAASTAANRHEAPARALSLAGILCAAARGVANMRSHYFRFLQRGANAHRNVAAALKWR